MLRERLQAIYEYIDECNCLIDIGTDHAYIPIKCVEEGKTKVAVAADINIGPVKIADKNIAKYGLSDSIKAIVSDGFEKLGDVKADAVVIAGMGGTLISEILERGLCVCGERFEQYKQIVLQPMNDIENLRRWLKYNSFVINEEHLVAEEAKIYCMMKIVYVGADSTVDEGKTKGADRVNDETDEETMEFLLGRLNGRHDELMQCFLEKMVNRRKRILAGFERSKDAHDGELTMELEAEYKRVERELRMLEEYNDEQ